MLPTLVLLVIAVVAVAAVVWSIRRKPQVRPYEERLDQDTAWNDPTTPRAPRNEPRPDDRP